MTRILIRDAKEPDFDRIVELNAAAVRETSAMDLDRLQRLHTLAFQHRVALADGRLVGFLLSMRDGAEYANDNFGWFAGRYPHFVYIDRIVVDGAFAGQGIGRLLYEDLFSRSRAEGIGIVACEYNLDPPNPASNAFHLRFGFVEVGRQRVADGTKLVSLQVAQLPGSVAP
ncbi:MAG: GNAT family N-acetyltransferase [Lysobacter sp.]|nr:GNAT family N-acetyltransferase [Lysobacter sp.]